jgi:hypothetical protein
MLTIRKQLVSSIRLLVRSNETAWTGRRLTVHETLPTKTSSRISVSSHVSVFFRLDVVYVETWEVEETCKYLHLHIHPILSVS